MRRTITIEELSSIGIAELQEYGCPMVCINLIEQHLKIIYLSQLVRITAPELTNVPNMGSGRVAQVVRAVDELLVDRGLK